jgi:RNA polymerase sigma factor (sigma-70 family)
VLRSQTDERLVDLVRAGNEPAFEAIVARYRRPLLRYCSRFLSDERAEDAVQQTFVNAYNAMRLGHAELNLRPWLYRIAHNTALNMLRDPGLHHEQLSEQFDGVERPDQALERTQGIRNLLAAVQGLPERQRDALMLRELEGRSYEEIAVALGVTGGAVRQLLNRARNTLRAAATAVTPMGLLTRIPWAAPAEPVTARVAELCTAGGTGAIAAKVCATALVTGAVAGGVAVTPDDGHEEPAKAKEAPSGERSGDAGGSGASRSGDGSSKSSARAGGTGDDGRSGRRSGSDIDRSGHRDGDGDRSGPGGGDFDGDGDSSGPGPGGGEIDSSGPGSGGMDTSGHGGSGSSGSGGGGDSGSSGSGSSGSGSGGSGSSGSGSSGSGSGSSGSGSSGSGSGDRAGSDSSGSGSGGGN